MLGLRIQPNSLLQRMALLGLLCLLALVTSNSASATQFFKCKNADGGTTLSQFPCATDADADTVSVGSGNVGYARPGLTAQERQILRDAEDELEEREAQQHQAAKQRDKEARNAERAEIHCERAKEHLEDVRDERRDGYRARHADYYDNRLRDAKALVDKRCDPR
ncbi:MAG: hypothetical protein NXH85_02585 [Pseudomonadaceae bacterium]|nr:hypothetical protein [Pseudomonadaceae bacterium]